MVTLAEPSLNWTLMSPTFTGRGRSVATLSQALSYRAQNYRNPSDAFLAGNFVQFLAKLPFCREVASTSVHLVSPVGRQRATAKSVFGR